MSFARVARSSSIPPSCAYGTRADVEISVKVLADGREPFGIVSLELLISAVLRDNIV